MFLEVEPGLYENYYPLIRFEGNVSNNSGQEITILVTESFVDGQAGGGAGIFDIPDGASLSDSFFVSPENREEDQDSFLNAQSGTVTLRVIDANSYSTLFDIPITFVRQGSVFIPSVGSSQSLPSTVAPEPTPNYQFHRELSNGDEGNDVVYLQTRLYLMRYYDGEIDGIFGNQTAQAVYAFKMANGIYDSGSEKYVATFEMLECLNSGSAIYYSEPEFALVLEGYGQWEFPGNDRIRMRVKVTNTAKSKTVKAFEMYMYAVDVWGDPIYGEDMVYYGTTEKTVSPGETVYSDYITMPDKSQVDTVYAGIHKIIYTDGTIKEASPVDYYYWEID